jgi:hypothetical protein
MVSSSVELTEVKAARVQPARLETVEVKMVRVGPREVTK